MKVTVGEKEVNKMLYIYVCVCVCMYCQQILSAFSQRVGSLIYQWKI